MGMSAMEEADVRLVAASSLKECRQHCEREAPNADTRRWTYSRLLEVRAVGFAPSGFLIARLWDWQPLQ